MTIPTKQLKGGFSIPVFGIGTWNMGGRFERNPDNDDARDIAAIQKAIEQGITHIDTAEVYAEGKSEEIVGKAIAKYDREKLVIVSKVFLEHMHYNDVIAACEASLKRLQTDYLDLYLLHRHDPHTPLEETMDAMNKLKERALIRNIGLSNFTVEAHKQATQYASTPIVATQVHYNLKSREPKRAGVLDYCQQNDTLLIAWRPIEKGALAESGIPVIDELCEKYNKTPAQIAINWLISQKNVVTISKSSNFEHLKENLGAVGWEMEQEDVKRISQEYPNQEDVSNTVPLG
ncbi:aldo/keto reductase [Patescibacteria group bacterium]|nr:aldo/keto reductase [Patescibacteria group bacterium]